MFRGIAKLTYRATCLYCLVLSRKLVLQQGIDLLRQRMQDGDLQRTAPKALLDQRAAGALVSGAQIDKSIARMITGKRRAHAVQN